MAQNNRADEIVDQVVELYLKSGDFNGFGVAQLNSDGDVAVLCDLITKRKLDLVRGDGHPNPHIKAFDAEPVDIQLSKIATGGLAGCLYPTPERLNELDSGANETAPYTRELMRGVPQLVHRSFDLRALEWYRNDPRFDFDVDDIHGRILQRGGTQVHTLRMVLENHPAASDYEVPDYIRTARVWTM